MVSRRFACLFLAVSMTLSSIWIVSADQSHQIQDAAEAAASYSAAVQALEEGLAMVMTFLETPFSEDPRHVRRLDMVTAYEDAHRA